MTLPSDTSATRMRQSTKRKSWLKDRIFSSVPLQCQAWEIRVELPGTTALLSWGSVLCDMFNGHEFCSSVLTAFRDTVLMEDCSSWEFFLLISVLS